MDFKKSRFVHAVVCVVFVMLFAAAAHLIASMATDSRNRQQVNEIAQQMLRRAELGVDFAFMALGSVAETNALKAGGQACSNNVRSNLRHNVFRRATIKDIRILDRHGRILCAAFPETVAGISFSIDIKQAIESRNSQVRLMAMPRAHNGGLGVIWQLDQDRYLMAIVNTSALLFDMLPPAIRDSSSANVMLAGPNKTIASFKPVGWAKIPTAAETFQARSSRFPLSARVHVEAKILAGWNQQISWILLLLAGLLGLSFGVLFVKTVFREAHPVAAIDKALAAKEFRPFFQPIFCLKTNQIMGCEVLARWVKADGAIIPPYQFIPLAEQTGRIVPMTWQLVDEALQQLRPFLRANKDFRVAFNFSVGHLLQDGFAEDLRQHVVGARAGTRQVTIEITEREEIFDFDRAAALVAQLQHSGYSVALDDAGTGHSGLSYVQKLGANIIKIDKLFVDTIAREHSARVLIGLLVNLGKELGMTTVAEGIETQEQADVLAELGVDKGQGYLVSKPVNARQFLDLVEINQATLGTKASRQAA